MRLTLDKISEISLIPFCSSGLDASACIRVLAITPSRDHEHIEIYKPKRLELLRPVNRHDVASDARQKVFFVSDNETGIEFFMQPESDRSLQSDACLEVDLQHDMLVKCRLLKSR
jgi:hypothetical protein